MPHQPVVFISYSSQDADTANRICRMLEDNGIPCWIAPRDVPPGLNWIKAIMNAMEAISVVVLVFSAHANTSEEVQTELHLARKKKKVLIPLRIEDVRYSDELEYDLAAVHYVNAFKGRLEDSLGPLIERVAAIMKTQTAASAWPGMQLVSRNEPAGPHGAAPARLSAAAVEDKAAARAMQELMKSVREAEKPLRVALLYKRKAQPDDHVLSLLESGLRAAGHEVFIDRHLHIGVEWATEIERHVREADAVIPLLSAAAVQSEMLEGEVKIAWEAAGQQFGKPRILPVRVNYDEALASSLYSMLGRLQYAMWRTPADDPTLLASMLDSLAAREPPQLIRREAPPTGTEPLDSPYYVVQPADLEFHAALESREEFIVCVKGARQMGKTSLLARGMEKAKEAGITVASVDFMGLNQTALTDIESLYKGLGEMIAVGLDLDVFPEQVWVKERAPNVNFERYLRREVLGRVEGYMILAMDEVDRLFAHAWASDVFGMFRSWHEERRRNPESHWKRLTLAFVYATEPHLFITRQDMSPFNVGTKLELQDFGMEQVVKLNHLYRDPLRSTEDLERFFALFNGQPYLTRRGFYELTTHGMTIDQLEAGATDEGPFGDHLRRILVMLATDKRLLAVVQGMVRGEAVPDQASFYRLRSGGLITGSSPQDAHFRCGIYKTYLARHLD